MIACLSTARPTRVLRVLKQWFLTPPFTGIQTVPLSATAGRYAPVLRLLRLLSLLRLRYIHRKFVEVLLFRAPSTPWCDITEQGFEHEFNQPSGGPGLRTQVQFISSSQTSQTFDIEHSCICYSMSTLTYRTGH